MRKIWLILFIFLLPGCGSRSDLAPVVESKWRPYNLYQNAHIVQRGETLYAVAFRYDQDVRTLAAYNHLKNPYALRVGQVIRLPKSHQTTYRASYSLPSTKSPKMASPRQNPVFNAHPYSTSRKAIRQTHLHGDWLWPANGQVVGTYLPLKGKKGIDIAGRRGEVVRAAGNGVVAYAGNGLSGYGNLIIIKHRGQYLTAYGNNLHNRVKEGQSVKAGQVIADMGIIDRKFWGVHFEIRQSGQPVNPMNYLRR